MTIKEIIQSFFSVNKNHFRELKRNRAITILEGLDSRELYQNVHAEAAPVFVLSTGRCGSLFLTKILSQHAGVDVHHDSPPELVYHSKYAFENTHKGEEIKTLIDGARYEYIRNAYINKELFVESNNRITFFAPQLAELYPNSKFVHLIREPYAFIRSGINRNWYSGKHIHDEGRIRLREKDIWDSYSIEEKIAWLWNETNSFIDDFKDTIRPDRHMTLTSGQLFKSIHDRKKLIEFMGIKGSNYKTPGRSNKQRKTAEHSIDKKKVVKVLTQNYTFG